MNKADEEMMARISKRFTKEEFLVWLQQQPADRIFLYSNPWRCLFACFIREHLDEHGFSVVPGMVVPDVHDEPRLRFPTWALKLEEIFLKSDTQHRQAYELAKVLQTI